MLAENLKKIRSNADISQNDLAKIMKVSQQTIGSWEVGRTEPDTGQILALANYFNVTTDYLLGKPDNPMIPDKKKETPAISQAEALRILAEGKKGGPLTQDELNRLDDVIDTIIKGIGN